MKFVNRLLARHLKKLDQAGFTLTELLIVVVIIAMLLLLLLLSLSNQVGRARDAQRKADLERIKVAFEDYFNDKGCYPPPDVLENCGVDSFQPYLKEIPCDPLRGEPYLYVPLEGNVCQGYRVYAILENSTDPIISQLGCLPDSCGFGGGYNYGISVGSQLVTSDIILTEDEETGPTLVFPSGYTGPLHACSPGGTCNVYADPVGDGCPAVFIDWQCEGNCGNINYLCEK